MSPKEARLFIAEDRRNLQELYAFVLESSSHVIAVSANSLTDALGKIQAAVDAGVNVAIVDGQLPHPYEGELVASALRAAIPGIKIIEISSSEEGFGDSYILKGGLADVDLDKIITEL